jgi:methylthioribose-1-phosphate isomerase
MVLEAIRYSSGRLDILDQLQLPHNTHFDRITSSTDAWHAIKAMRTRGAPAIAIVAALSLAVELANTTVSDSPEEVKVSIEEKLDYLVTSRPTAVNLADAAFKLKRAVEDAAGRPGATGDAVRAAYLKAAEQMLVDDVSDNEAIGRHGAEWILNNTEHGKSGKVSVLTHCNTGYVGLWPKLSILKGSDKV